MAKFERIIRSVLSKARLGFTVTEEETKVRFMAGEPYMSIFSDLYARAMHPDSFVRSFAKKIITGASGPFNAEQICVLWDYVQKAYKYQYDPRMYIDHPFSATQIIRQNFTGDCDDIAIVTSALISAIGGSPRVIVADDVDPSSKSGHAYCEVFAGVQPSVLAEYLIYRYANLRVWRPAIPEGLIRFHRSLSGGYWLNLDMNPGVIGGQIYVSSYEIAIYPDGKWETIWHN